jgi:hypothetical protein
MAGAIFGAVAQLTHFCTMGALSDVVYMGDWRRMRSWLLAIAVAIIGTQVLASAGMVDLSQSVYLTPNLGWPGAIIGGLLFGFGMTLAGGCGNKTLVRIGGGNLKSIVVFLIIGVFAYMTMRGIIGLARLQVEMANINLAQAGLPGQGLPEMLAALTGMAPAVLRWVMAGLLAGGLAVFCFANADFLRAPGLVMAGVVIGLLITAGWWITGVLGADDFTPAPLASFTFIAPIADSMQYLMTYTGATINFGIAAVGGVIAGAFLAAILTGNFRIEAFTSASDMKRHMFGAAIMGIGGVMALGCSIGQGLTGMSTLAAGSLIALVSIWAGGFAGLKWLEAN